MDNNHLPKERETIVDIVSSESEFEEDCKNETLIGNKRAKTVVRSVGRTRTKTVNFEAQEEGECSSNSYRNSVKSSDDDYEDIESLTLNKEHTPLLEKTQLKEKRKISHTKKAPKPPRPRKGPSLDTADLQLVKEIAEQTMKRRARVERLKAMKKRRSAKSSSSSSPPSSSNSSLLAMLVTVLFFLVIIFQGFGSGQSSTLTFDDSPKSSGAPSSGLISIELGNNLNDVQQIANPPKKIVTRKIYATTTTSTFVEQKSVSDIE